MADLLYSGLTTGAGLQTLGEEYCDILQAAGACLLIPVRSSAAVAPVGFMFKPSCKAGMTA